MDAFGDVSGTFRGLITHHCPVVVVGVVIGDRIAASRCPKNTIRNVQDVQEAKWRNMTEVQKRRMIDCFADNDHLEFGYAVFTADDLHELACHYLLHQGVDFPPAWDIALTGYAYGEILFEYGAREERRVVFETDRMASKPQWDSMINHVERFVPSVSSYVKGSQENPAVQAADCLAGATAEDHKRNTDWLSEIADDRIVNCSQLSLIQLENDLTDYDGR